MMNETINSKNIEREKPEELEKIAKINYRHFQSLCKKYKEDDPEYYYSTIKPLEEKFSYLESIVKQNEYEKNKDYQSDYNKSLFIGGKRIVWFVSIYIVLADFLVTLFSSLIIPNKPIIDHVFVIRFLISVLILSFLIMGFRWAKYLIAFLLILGGIFGSFINLTVYISIERSYLGPTFLFLIPLFLTVTYLILGILLLTSPKVDFYVNEKTNSRKRG